MVFEKYIGIILAATAEQTVVTAHAHISFVQVVSLFYYNKLRS